VVVGSTKNKIWCDSGGVDIPIYVSYPTHYMYPYPILQIYTHSHLFPASEARGELEGSSKLCWTLGGMMGFVDVHVRDLRLGQTGSDSLLRVYEIMLVFAVGTAKRADSDKHDRCRENV
jgi:hypothetical protein